MTQKQAEDIVKELLYPSKNNGRLFTTNTERPVCGNANVLLSGSVMTYNANYAEDAGSGIEGSVQAGTARVVKRYVIKSGRFKLDLKDISKLRLWKTTDSTFKVPCPNTIPGYNVIVYQSASSITPIFNVSGEDLDRLLAALLYYSPGAEIKEGLGF